MTVLFTNPAIEDLEAVSELNKSAGRHSIFIGKIGNKVAHFSVGPGGQSHDILNDSGWSQNRNI